MAGWPAAAPGQHSAHARPDQTPSTTSTELPRQRTSDDLPMALSPSGLPRCRSLTCGPWSTKRRSPAGPRWQHCFMSLTKHQAPVDSVASGLQLIAPAMHPRPTAVSPVTRIVHVSASVVAAGQLLAGRSIAPLTIRGRLRSTGVSVGNENVPDQAAGGDSARELSAARAERTVTTKSASSVSPNAVGKWARSPWHDR